jgi:DNA-binding NarL/FixJ family response regulator
LAAVTDRIRVLVAHGHPRARAGIREALQGAEFESVEEAADASTAVAVALRERPDVCLLDVQMAGGGTAAAREIRAGAPDTVVLMISSGDGSDRDLFEALRAGARGYLSMDIDPTRLPHVLRGVLVGEAAMSRRLVARLIDEFCTHGRRRRLGGNGTRPASLTWREWEVLELLHEGLSTAEAAKRLTVSPVTVRRHVSAILEKLEVPDRRAALSRFAELR